MVFVRSSHCPLPSLVSPAASMVTHSRIIRIGSSPSADIVAGGENSGIAPIHCEIHRKHDRCYLHPKSGQVILDGRSITTPCEWKIHQIASIGAGVLLPWPWSENSPNLWLGRARDCDVVLDHLEVSGRHAKIGISPHGAVTLIDSKSRNGIRIHSADSPRVQRVLLTRGTKVFFGSHAVTADQILHMLPDVEPSVPPRTSDFEETTQASGVEDQAESSRRLTRRALLCMVPFLAFAAVWWAISGTPRPMSDVMPSSGLPASIEGMTENGDQGPASHRHEKPKGSSGASRRETALTPTDAALGWLLLQHQSQGDWYRLATAFVVEPDRLVTLASISDVATSMLDDGFQRPTWLQLSTGQAFALSGYRVHPDYRDRTALVTGLRDRYVEAKQVPGPDLDERVKQLNVALSAQSAVDCAAWETVSRLPFQSVPLTAEGVRLEQRITVPRGDFDSKDPYFDLDRLRSIPVTLASEPATWATRVDKISPSLASTRGAFGFRAGAPLLNRNCFGLPVFAQHGGVLGMVVYAARDPTGSLQMEAIQTEVMLQTLRSSSAPVLFSHSEAASGNGLAAGDAG
ncbi:MAG: FHA domain-containing protein [Planctomycetota bacterium]